MKKKNLLLFVILTMMCSAKVSANTLMMRALVQVTTNADDGTHTAFVTLTDVGSGYNLMIYCPDLNTGNDICYASISSYNIDYKIDELCEDHNTSFPTDPTIHLYSIDMLEWLQYP